MNKRDYIAEILSKKSRLYPSSTRWELVAGQLQYLLEALDDMEEFLEAKRIVDHEVLRYFPIRLVACIEGYFRLAYADLIDYGSPFRENTAKFEIKFTIDTALSLQRHSVTLGEFVAHLLPTNNLQDINGSISKIINDDFLQRLKARRLTLIRQPYIIPEFEAEADSILIGGINRLFETRHILSHELAPVLVPSLGNAVGLMQITTEFLRITEAVMADLLEPSPLISA